MTLARNFHDAMMSRLEPSKRDVERLYGQPDLVWWPCERCETAGREPEPFGGKWRECPRCKGTGSIIVHCGRCKDTGREQSTWSDWRAAGHDAQVSILLDQRQPCHICAGLVERSRY